jgi:Fic/DOC family N-terminal
MDPYEPDALPLTTQEAVLSSKIEGTQATVDEVLAQEAGLLREGAKFQDIQEISTGRSGRCPTTC